MLKNNWIQNWSPLTCGSYNWQAKLTRSCKPAQPTKLDQLKIAIWSHKIKSKTLSRNWISLKIVLAMAYFWPFELVWVFMLSVCRFSECLKRRDKFDMTFLTRYPTEILSLKFPFEIKFKTFQFKTTHWEHKTYKNAKYLWWYHKCSVSNFKFLGIKKLRRYRSFEINPCRCFKI